MSHQKSHKLRVQISRSFYPEVSQEGAVFGVTAILSVGVDAGAEWSRDCMCLRIHFKNVVAAGQVIGVHYHYEVVIGATGDNPLVRAFNQQLTKAYSPEFFAAWQLHNAIDVGTFENFLPALFGQSGGNAAFRYARGMNPMTSDISLQRSHAPDLFRQRVDGFKSNSDTHSYQAPDSASFL